MHNMKLFVLMTSRDVLRRVEKKPEFVTYRIIESPTDICPVQWRIEGKIFPVLSLQLFKVCIFGVGKPAMEESSTLKNNIVLTCYCVIKTLQQPIY